MPESRHYSATALETTLTVNVNASATVISVGATTGFPVELPFTLIVDKDTASEEVMEVSEVAGLNLTVTRGVDGTTGVPHATGAVVVHGVSARDFRESRVHEASATAHGVSGVVVGTEGTQTLEDKTLVTPSVASFENAQHDHTDAEGGGTIPQSAVVDLSKVVVPVGAVLPYSSVIPPSDRWLLCDGQAVSRSTYAALFTLVGTRYGAGDGSTTFNLPNLNGRVPRGTTTAEQVGQTGGADSTVLGTNQMPQHTHAIDHDHPSFTASGSGGHGHNFKTAEALVGGSTSFLRPNWGSGGFDASAGDSSIDHSHTINVPGFTGISGTAGAASPAAVPTVPAFMSLAFIIRVA